MGNQRLQGAYTEIKAVEAHSAPSTVLCEPLQTGRLRARELEGRVQGTETSAYLAISQVGSGVMDLQESPQTPKSLPDTRSEQATNTDSNKATAPNPDNQFHLTFLTSFYVCNFHLKVKIH